MQVIYEKNFNLEQIISTKAKFQKVMLIYDETVSNFELKEVENKIKSICVFNKLDLNNSDINEIYNGYRLLVFLCSTNSFIKLNFRTDEFVSIFKPTDNGILPYFLTDNHKKDIENYLIISKEAFDFNILPSVLFNKFYNYLEELYFQKPIDVEFEFKIENITQTKTIDMIQRLKDNFKFVDLELIKQMEIDYKFLPIVDYVLISAFLCVISSIKNKTIELVDLYKFVKDNNALIDKFYHLVFNDMFLNLITLNYNSINFSATKTREEILSFDLNIFNETCEFKNIISKVKEYASNTDNLLVYLYIFNCFGL